MRFRHLLLTTFNRQLGGGGGFPKGRELDEGWLRHRWRLFTTYTVPSVAAQSERDFTWVVLCHPESPDWLRALAGPIEMDADVYFSFLRPDPAVTHFAGDTADALLVTRIGPNDSWHRRAMERIREDCAADPYTSEIVTLTDGYVLDHEAGRMMPCHSSSPPFCTRISLDPGADPLGLGAGKGMAGRGPRARSISDGEPMFVLVTDEKQRPHRPGYPADGRWLAVEATAEILARDFGVTLARDRASWDSAGPAGLARRPRAQPASKPAWLSARPAASRRQRVVVSVPCFQAWDSVAGAVESVLGQTHSDLLVIVANDGDDHPRWEALGHIDDPRLVRVDYPVNRGRYFVDQIVLMARLGQYLLIHDADEWSEPGRVQSLLEQLRRGHGIAAVSPHYQHGTEARGSSAIVSPVLAPAPVTAAYRAGPGGPAGSPYQALFDVPSMLSIGGSYGGYRLEYDTFLFHLLRMAGTVMYLDQPLYHRADRAGWPTASEQARFDPAARQSAARQLARLYAEAYHVYCEYLAGSVGFWLLCQQLRTLAWRHVSASQWTALRDEASRLRWQVNGATASPRADPDGRLPGAGRRIVGPRGGDRLLAAYTVPAHPAAVGPVPVLSAGTEWPARPRPAAMVVTGILTARSRTTLEPDTVAHALLPHDAVLVLERTGADLVIIEAAAMLPGSAWSYAADPAGADRGRRLAALVDAAHALGKPVVFLRNAPRDRIPGLAWLDAMCDAVADGDLGVQLARFNPIDLPARRPDDPLYAAARDPRERPGQRRVLDQLTAGARPAVRVVDPPWQELPAWYRRHGVFLAASAGQAREQLACGARVVGPVRSSGVAALADAAAMIGQLDAARAAGAPAMSEIRPVLREIFAADATPVRLAAIARMAGLPTDGPPGRQVAVLAEVPDGAAAETLVGQLLRQRLRPAEVVAFGPAWSPPAASPPPRRRDPDGHAASDAIAAALDVLADAGITVRIARGADQREAVRQVRLPWIAPWGCRAEHSEWYLTDLMCARECSGADVVGLGPGADYAFGGGAEPALVRWDLLAPGAPPPPSWGRRGVRTLTIAD